MVGDQPNRKATEHVLYEEKPEIDSALFKALFALIIMDNIVIGLVLVYLRLPWIVLIPVLVIEAFVFGLILSFLYSRKVMLSNWRIFVRFGPARSSIPLSAVRSFSVQNLSSWHTSSSGVSPGRGKLVYCFRTGSPFVMIERDTERFRRVFFNVEDPSRFTRTLERLVRHLPE